MNIQKNKKAHITHVGIKSLKLLMYFIKANSPFVIDNHILPQKERFVIYCQTLF